MLMTPGLAGIFILMKLFGGLFIGLIVSTFFGPRFRPGLAVMCAIVGGVVFLLFSLVSGWADSQATFVNGIRMDIGPGGEDLWLKNRLAEYGLIISIVISFGAALLCGLLSHRPEEDRSEGNGDT
jgi:multisubunit Na+/H+ antiporter MnhB subunit